MDKWKIIAIVFITLFFLENLWFGLVYLEINRELTKEKECWFDFCSEYPDALYEDDICYCYDYDLLDNLIVAESKFMR